MTHVNSLIIVADRGSLRAYRVDPLPDRAPRLTPVSEVDFSLPHLRVSDQLTDRAGRFGARDSAGRPGPDNNGGGGGTLEKPALDLENERRAVKQVAEQLAAVLREHQPAGWSLAAPKQILSPLLDHLPKEWTGKIVEKVGADLAHLPAGELTGHFPSLQRDHRHSV